MAGFESFDKQRVSTTASSIAMHPPWPILGVVGCAASPSKVQAPSLQRFTGGRSEMAVLIIAVGSVARITLEIGRCQFPTNRCNLAFAPSGRSLVDSASFAVHHQAVPRRP